MKWSSLAVLLIVFATPFSARADLFGRLAIRQPGDMSLSGPETAPPAIEAVESGPIPDAVEYQPYSTGYHHHHGWGHSTVLGTGCCLDRSHLADRIWGNYCCKKHHLGWLWAKHKHINCCEPACHRPLRGHSHTSCCKPKFGWLKHRCGCGHSACETCVESCCDPCSCERRPLFPRLLALFHGKHCHDCGAPAADCGCHSGMGGEEIWSDGPVDGSFDLPMRPVPSEPAESSADEADRRGLFSGKFLFSSHLLGR